jgi:hypothetical protein
VNYDPENANHRQLLASTLCAMLMHAGFEEEPPKDQGWYTRKEKLFSREVGGGIRVAVYTTIVGDETRKAGKDAIRVAAIYTNRNGDDKGIARCEKRVNRTGEIVAITDRTLDRMREVWKLAKVSERCHCGAPMFRSRNGNHVCADICWENPQRRTA